MLNKKRTSLKEDLSICNEIIRECVLQSLRLNLHSSSLLVD